MANRITYTELDPVRNLIVTASSRYSESRIIYYGNLNRLTFETYKKRKYVPSEDDKYTVIPAGYEYRPDLLSKEFYGIPDFWWKILEANDIKDIYDFKAGTNVWLPANIFMV